MAVVLNAPGAFDVEVVGVGERGGVCVSSSETECLRDWYVRSSSDMAAELGKEDRSSVDGFLEVVLELGK